MQNNKNQSETKINKLNTNGETHCSHSMEDNISSHEKPNTAPPGKIDSPENIIESPSNKNLNKTEKYFSATPLNRLALFLFSMLTGLFLLYVFGNMQDFLDESQIIILHFLVVISLLLFIVSIAACVLNITLYLKTAKRQFITVFLFHLVMIFAGLSSAFIYTFVIVVSKTDFLF